MIEISDNRCVAVIPARSQATFSPAVLKSIFVGLTDDDIIVDRYTQTAGDTSRYIIRLGKTFKLANLTTYRVAVAFLNSEQMDLNEENHKYPRSIVLQSVIYIDVR